MGEILCQVEGAIARVTLSHPGKLNALNLAMWQSLRSTFESLHQDEALRCILVSGAEGNFAAGADIAEFSTVRATLEDGMRYHNEVIAPALQAISACRHPTVAAIEGACVGGGLEIACACDIRIAAPDARFGIPINRLGFPLAPGELQGLLDLVGKAATLEILLEGRVFDAAEAKDKGLVQRIAADIDAEAQACIEKIVRGAPLAARANKAMVSRLSVAAPALSEQEIRQAFAFLESQDYREGVASFLSKTAPRFTGK